jgi:hypothetical protein
MQSDAPDPDAEIAPGLQLGGAAEQPAMVNRPAQIDTARMKAAPPPGHAGDCGRIIAHEVSAAGGRYGSQPSELTIVGWLFA